MGKGAQGAGHRQTVVLFPSPHTWLSAGWTEHTAASSAVLVTSALIVPATARGAGTPSCPCATAALPPAAVCGTDTRTTAELLGSHAWLWDLPQQVRMRKYPLQPICR